MIVLVGPSASGKTTIANKLIEDYKFKKLITTTTRKMRINEVNDVDYHFIDVEEFNKRKENNLFLETVEYSGNYYGSQIDEVARDKVIIVDVNGANSIYDKINNDAVIFFIECDEDILRKRMTLRGDKEEDIIKRLSVDKIHFSLNLLKHIDYIINTSNKDVDQISKEIYEKYRLSEENYGK